MTDLTRGRSHNVVQYTGNPLDEMFAPRSVAVIGASEREGSIGLTVFSNLLRGPFNGPVFPVNPLYYQVLGETCYHKVVDLPQVVDLAVVATPSEAVPRVVRECGEAGIKFCVILSAGFKEIGEQGAELEQQVLAEAKKGRVRLVGPNCVGIMNPYQGLNATFASRMALKGNVGFASQSGALFTAILDWSIRENVGFSSFVSTGSMVDVDWGDLIYYFGDDPRTKSILIYMETIGDARSFMSAAREVSLTKPIIVIKPGRTEAGARAAAAHTGAETGDDAAIDAAFRRCGALRVDTIADLFNLAEVLAKQPRPIGPRLMIVTNGGGPGVSAADALLAAGGQLAPLSPSLLKALDEILPFHWSRANPIDILGDAGPERYQEVVSLVAKDSDSDGLLAILTPQAMTKPKETAEVLKTIYDRPAGYPYGKPVLASWMGGEDIGAGIEVLNQANIPTFSYPDTAARLFTYMWRYQKRLQSLYETPHLPIGADESSLKRFLVGELIADVRNAGRILLTDHESRRILEAYGIPTVDTALATTETQALSRAEEFGYPVIVRRYSTDGAQQSIDEVEQVRVDNPEQLHAACEALRLLVDEGAGTVFEGVMIQPVLDTASDYELQVGSRPDSQLGPVLSFGLGGVVGEAIEDVALGIPPLNTTLARRMMEPTMVYQGMVAVGRYDLEALEDLLVRFSQLVVEQRWIRTMTINPLQMTDAGPMVVEAHIELYGLETTEAMLPPLAIRPYPMQYVKTFENRNGVEFTIRPIRPEDEPFMVEFHAKLSEESVYLRFFRAFDLDERVAHERLTRLCFVDYDRTIALVIEWMNPETNEPEIVAAGRLTRMPDPLEAEFALLVRDDFQGQGLGTVLLTRLLQFGRDEGIERVVAYMLATNTGMINICKKLGFRFEREEDLLKAIIDLHGENVPAAESTT